MWFTIIRTISVVLSVVIVYYLKEKAHRCQPIGYEIIIIISDDSSMFLFIMLLSSIIVKSSNNLFLARFSDFLLLFFALSLVLTGNYYYTLGRGFVRWKAPCKMVVVGLLSWHGSHFWVCITFCKVRNSNSITKLDYYYY